MDFGFKLKENAKNLPNNTAVIFQDEKISYKEYNQRAAKFANAMISLGLKPRDKVAVISRSSAKYLEIIAGLVKGGMVHVPVIPRFAPQEMEYVINNSEAVAVLVSAEFVEKVISIRKDLPNVPEKNYIVIGDEVSNTMQNYDKFIAGASDAEPGIENGEFDPYFIGYTSGTTGRPKGAVTRHANWPAKVTGFSKVLGVNTTPDEVQLLCMPLFHMNAINTAGLSLYFGQTVVIMSRFTGEEALRLIDTYQCTFSSMVPTMYHRIKNLPDEVKAGFDISSMKSLLQSSAPLPFTTKKWIVEFFKNASLFEGYGGTEAGVVTLLLPQYQLTKPNSVGQPLPTIDVRIVDDNGNEVPQGQIGQFSSRTKPSGGAPIPAVTEYYRNPEATAANFKDGWFFSGDMAYMDEEGFIYLVDRKHDMIISGGENIYPKEIEDVFYSHPKISEVAIVGIPDEEWGESVKGVVVLKEGEKVSQEELIEHCKKHLGKYKTPKSVDFVDDLPKTDTGKILRRLVKEQYWKDKDRKI